MNDIEDMICRDLVLNGDVDSDLFCSLKDICLLDLYDDEFVDYGLFIDSY